jgi:hypothetical protein
LAVAAAPAERPTKEDAMAETTPPVSVVQQKDINVVQFTNNRILDEANIADIGNTLKVLIETAPTPSCCWTSRPSTT